MNTENPFEGRSIRQLGQVKTRVKLEGGCASNPERQACLFVQELLLDDEMQRRARGRISHKRPPQIMQVTINGCRFTIRTQAELITLQQRLNNPHVTPRPIITV